MHVRRTLLALCGAVPLLVSSTLVVGGMPVVSAAPAPPSTFIGLLRNEPVTLDPAIGADDPSLKVISAIYEPLIMSTPDGNGVTPWLATSWKAQKSGLQYVFQLRPHVYFHDGSVLTSQAVVLSFQRMIKMNLGNAWAFTDVKSVVAAGPLTVDINLKKPEAQFLDVVPLAYIISAKALTSNPNMAKSWLTTHEDGTGPYTLTQWQKNAQMTFQAFPQYWQGWKGSHYQTLILRLVTEPETQRVVIQEGQANWADSINEGDLSALKTAGFQVISHSGYELLYMMFNMDVKPLNNVLVRRALRYAFPYQEMVKDIMVGYASVPHGYIPAVFAANHEPAEQYNLAKARQLLKEAGYPHGGFTLTMNYFNGLSFEASGAQLLEANLAKLGIKLKATSEPWASMLINFSKPPAQRDDISFYEGEIEYPSPEAVFQDTFYSHSTNWSEYGYSNPTVDKLTEDAATNGNVKDENKDFVKIDNILESESPGICALIEDSIQVFSAATRGYVYYVTNPDIIYYYQLHPRSGG